MYHYYLLAQAEKGNREAFWVLVEQFLPVLYNKAWLLAGGRQDLALELVVSGLVEAWQRFQGAPAELPFCRFLERTLVKVALGFPGWHKEAAPSSRGDGSGEAGLVERLIRLEREQRFLVVLRFLGGYQLEELGRTMKMKEEGLREALCAALLALAGEG